MKTISTSILLLIISLHSIAQQRTTNSSAKENSYLKSKEKIELKNITETIDTLDFPPPETVFLFTATDGGYVTGNNSYKDKAKANLFNRDAFGYQIMGGLFMFAVATGENYDVEFAVWDNTGTAGGPGNKLTSATLPVNEIKLDIDGNFLSLIEFDEPIQVYTPFYMGIILPQSTEDSLAVFSTDTSAVFHGKGWEQWEDNSWITYSDGNAWGLNIANAIYPIVQETNPSLAESIKREEEITIYPNPSSKQITITNKSNNKQKIQIVSLQGQLLFNEYVDAYQQKSINISSWQTGIYIVKQIKEKQIETCKISIIR